MYHFHSGCNKDSLAGSIRVGDAKDGISVKVDYFCKHADLFLLTHAHSDHLEGISKKWNPGDHGGGPFCCTKDTYTILTDLGLAPKQRGNNVTILSEGRNTVKLNDRDGTCVDVHVIPDDHCIGSCLFVVQYKGDTILHTGDYKYDEKILQKIESALGGKENGNRVGRIYIDPTFWDKSWSDKQLMGYSYIHCLVKNIKDVRKLHPRRNICLLISSLGNEKIMADLYEQLGVPTLFDTNENLHPYDRRAWERMKDNYEDGVVTGSRKEWVEKGGYVFACPAFVPRCNRRKLVKRMKAMAQQKAALLDEKPDDTAVAEEYQRLMDDHRVERASLFAGWYHCEKLHRWFSKNKEVREEDIPWYLKNESAVEENIPVCIRLSTLTFCKYDHKGSLVFSGKKEKKTWHQYWPTPKLPLPTKVPILRILYSMHSLRFEHDKLVEKLGLPQVMCGLHGQNIPFGTVLQVAKERGGHAWHQDVHHGFVKMGPLKVCVAGTQDGGYGVEDKGLDLEEDEGEDEGDEDEDEDEEDEEDEEKQKEGGEEEEIEKDDLEVIKHDGSTHEEKVEDEHQTMSMEEYMDSQTHEIEWNISEVLPDSQSQESLGTIVRVAASAQLSASKSPSPEIELCDSHSPDGAEGTCKSEPSVRVEIMPDSVDVHCDKELETKSEYESESEIPESDEESGAPMLGAKLHRPEKRRPGGSLDADEGGVTVLLGGYSSFLGRRLSKRASP